MSFQRLLIGLIAAVLLAALVPAGVALERRLADALEARTREDLARMPAMLEARRAAASDGYMMRAKELAATPGLAAAVAEGDPDSARRLLDEARGDLGHSGVLVTAAGDVLAGIHPGRAMLEATRRGEMPVEVIGDGGGVRTVAISPLFRGGVWVGAAGFIVEFDRIEAATLAGLTRAEVIVVDAAGRMAASSRTDSAADLAGADLAAPHEPGFGEVTPIVVAGRRHLAVGAPAGASGAIWFLRDLEDELAVLPRLRRTALLSAGGALALALLLGAITATALARPAGALAKAADRVAAGDFDAPLPRPRIGEFRRVTDAFAAMRTAMARRLDELESANRELADRQKRLAELQSELIRRDRLVTAGQLVSQLAHEIRNPVANVRNCLELLRRRMVDSEARELTDLATDELLRMHEIAERVLDLHRPAAPDQQACDVAAVARNVAALVRLGADGGLTLHVTGDRTAPAAIPPDAIKQVLLTIVQNAQEAMDGSGAIQLHVVGTPEGAFVEITDTGPGIPEAVLPRIFDPFFTTKKGVQGVGLGLFVADAILRSHGGRVSAHNVEPHGARFRVELEPADRGSPAHPAQALA